jgi:hypothetical protein
MLLGYFSSVCFLPFGRAKEANERTHTKWSRASTLSESNALLSAKMAPMVAQFKKLNDEISKRIQNPISEKINRTTRPKQLAPNYPDGQPNASPTVRSRFTYHW